MSILVYVAQYQGVAQPVSWEILGKAAELAGVVGGPVVALVAGHNVGEVAREAVAYGADQVLLVDASEYAHYRAGALAATFVAAIDACRPQIILAPAIVGARDVAALAAAARQIGMAADVQSIELGPDGKLVADRPVFSGNILTTVTFRGPVQMATVRSRSYGAPASQPGRSGEIVPLQVALNDVVQAEEIIGFEGVVTGDVDLQNASIIVAGGRGAKGPEGFEPLKRLAHLLGAAIGASRAATDAGWVPYNTQVGQTGKTVRPDLYIAAGISGAIQHLAGISGAKIVVAVNKDKDAPIFNVARYGIIGDLFEVIPALEQAFRQKLGK